MGDLCAVCLAGADGGTIFCGGCLHGLAGGAVVSVAH